MRLENRLVSERERAGGGAKRELGRLLIMMGCSSNVVAFEVARELEITGL